MTEQNIDITPHRSLMRKMSYVNFRFEESISEFIDNSIDARIENEPLIVSLEINKNYIQVEDNGSGMDEEEMKKCLILADTEKEGTLKLGQFGLGLKSGALSLGKNFTVISTKRGLENQFRIEFDEEKFEKEGKWDEHPIFIEPKTFDHGTKIIVRDLKVKIYRQKTLRLKDNISLRFEPFIKQDGGEDVQILINGEELKAPVLEFQYPQNIPIYFTVFGMKVRGWLNFLKKRSIKGRYGFNLFKNKRLIKAYAKDAIGIIPHPEKAQLYGELHLDDFPTTHNKMEFLTDTPEWDTLKKKLEKILTKPFSSYIKGVMDTRKLKRTIRGINEIAKFVPNINIKPIESELEPLKEKLKEIELTEQTFERINIENQWFSYEPKITRKGENFGLFNKEITNQHITIEINIDFILFKLKETPDVLLSVFLLAVSEALAEVIMEKSGGNLESFYKNRDLILNTLIKRTVDKKYKEDSLLLKR